MLPIYSPVNSLKKVSPEAVLQYPRMLAAVPSLHPGYPQKCTGKAHVQIYTEMTHNDVTYMK